MPRRKVKTAGKGKKTTTGRTTTKTGTSTAITALEKTFKELPGKLVAQGRKEIGVLKQKEKKLAAQLKKATTQHQTATKQVATYTAKNKTKPTAAGKKQLGTANSTVAKHKKTVTGLTTELNAVKAQTKTLSSHTNKYTTLGKTITSFGKDWSTKNATSTTGAKKTTRKKTTKKPTTTQTSDITSKSNYDSNTSTPNKTEFEVTE
jgi:hypothetical protein